MSIMMLLCKLKKRNQKFQINKTMNQQGKNHDSEYL